MHWLTGGSWTGGVMVGALYGAEAGTVRVQDNCNYLACPYLHATLAACIEMVSQRTKIEILMVAP